MTGFRLSGYLSPAKEPPTFVIPTFSRLDRNEVFVQDLTDSGLVNSFALVDIELFYPVPAIPPHIIIKENEPGLLAYWADQGKILIGVATTFKEAIRSEVSSEPFAELELAALLEDEDRVAEAAKQIATELGSGAVANRWRQRELAALQGRKTANKSKGPSFTDPEDEAKEAAFQRLINEPNASSWGEQWNNLWKQGYKRTNLEQIALWWIELGPGQSESGGAVLGALLRGSRDTRVDEHVEEWLRTYSITNASWLPVWNALQSSRNRPSIAFPIAIEKLRDSAASVLMSYQWCFIWRSLWRSQFERPELIRIAEASADNGRVVTRVFVESVLLAILSTASGGPAIAATAGRWLQQRPQSTVLWAEIFLRTVERDFPSLLAVGRFWLSHHGGNLNRWYDIWQSLREYLSPREWSDLAISWLYRARWDLTAWPKVFNSLATTRLAGDQLLRLRNVGTRWTHVYGTYTPKKGKIEKALSYLDTLSPPLT
jgi:hypothetical protein